MLKQIVAQMPRVGNGSASTRQMWSAPAPRDFEYEAWSAEVDSRAARAEQSLNTMQDAEEEEERVVVFNSADRRDARR